MAFLEGSAGTTAKHKKGLCHGPDRYAAIVTRPPLEPEELLPETCGPCWVSDLQKNRSKGEEVPIYRVVS